VYSSIIGSFLKDNCSIVKPDVPELNWYFKRGKTGKPTVSQKNKTLDFLS